MLSRAKLVLATVLLLAPAAGTLNAADKNGVSPTAISRPSGPGSLEGLGEAFQPALNTGMPRYSVGITLPGGVAGFTPDLTLQYDGGRGGGPAGIGWSFGPGAIRRQADKGLPRYVDQSGGSQPVDRFVGPEGEELIPLANGCFLAKTEGAFVRYRPIYSAVDGQIVHWEAHTKSGIKLDFGLTSPARLNDRAGNRIYQWNLERETDTNGNVIEYTYIMPSADDRQIYLSEIRYGPGAPPWEHCYKIAMTYEDRPDPFTDYRSGFKVRTSRRLSRIDIEYSGTLIRRYVLGYGAHEHWSLLTTVTTVGDDGTSTLPATTFRYATFAPCDPDDPVSAAGRTIGSVGEPGQVMDSSLVELIDLNADGLPDLLDTSVGHTAYLNRGVMETEEGRAFAWEGPVDIAAEDPRARAFTLAAGNVHLADMTGDAIADLVVTDDHDVEFFANSGQAGWSSGVRMYAAGEAPPAPFGEGHSNVVTGDFDFDKRIDIARAESFVYTLWFNLGEGRYSSPQLSDGAYWDGQFIAFGDHGVQLADVNGDRLSDVVKVIESGLVYCANMGFGKFDECVHIGLPPEDPPLNHDQAGRAKLTDINGDGLADLVVEQFSGADLRFWLNMGNDRVAPSSLIADLPVSSNAVTRWADINGNGTTDLVYADSTLPNSKINAVDIAELVAGSAHFNALVEIENGYGRRDTILYRSTSDYCIDAFRAGHPWSTAVPFPTTVVSRVETSIGLDLDGFPDEGANGDVYVTDYVYRDGYYDPLEKQFRGFGFVKQIQRGDERFGGSDAPALVTRYGFHTGAPDGVDNDGDGSTDESGLWTGREEEPLKGVELWRERAVLPDDPLDDGSYAPGTKVFDRSLAAWAVRDLCTADGGALSDLLGQGYRTDDEYDRCVQHAVRTVVHTWILELGNGDPKELESRFDLDPLGNQLYAWNYGDVTNPSDDLYTGYEYAMNEPAWIVDRVSRRLITDGGPDGAFVSKTQNYYDGVPLEGLPLGQIGDEGNLHRTEAFISVDPVPPLPQRSLAIGDPRDPMGNVNVMRRQLSPYGNPIVLLDANGNQRRIDYDSRLHTFPVRETVVLGDGDTDLVVQATYHYGFGKPLSFTDMNGHLTSYAYDTFGRLALEVLPGDSFEAPTRTYAYDLGAPISTITTALHSAEGNSPDVVTVLFFDGLGRKLGTFDAGGPAMQEVTLYSTRGLAWKVYQPFAGGDGTWTAPQDDSLPARATAYDATGRIVETVMPPDKNGLLAIHRSAYQPLRTVEYDGEDNNPDSAHYDTPRTLVTDGLGRLIEVHEIEMLSAADSGTFITRYRYAPPDHLAEIEDAGGNVRYTRYDGLGRKIFSNDCDRGHLTLTYDPAGNLIQIVDAKGQTTVLSYDGANRALTKDYLDSGTPLSLERSPDVAYHYDQPSPEHARLGNMRGRLSWVEDLSGAEFMGYNARGDLEATVKRVSQTGGGAFEYTTTMLFDSLGRAYQITYPDGSVVRQEYNSRGLLHAVPGFIRSIGYTPAGRREAYQTANTVRTDYGYDPRLRLTRLTTFSATHVLQDLAFSYEHADNIIEIIDGRGLPADDPRSHTAAFTVDDSYRLIKAEGIGYGTIEYDYDRLGNMVSKTSPDIADPAVNLGVMTSGGTVGTSERIGRNPGDPPGPHALTSADNGLQLVTLDYDANGNTTSIDGDEYLYDFADRLGKVITGSSNIRYLYDYAGRRVVKRVDGAQTSYVDRLSEVRGGELIKYVFADRTRVARVTGSIPPPETVAQRIPLADGWNLFSFQVSPASTAPAGLLAGLDGTYTAVYGYEDGAYTRYEPNGAFNTLHALQPNRGYWIYMTTPADLLVEGPVSRANVEIPAGAPALVGMPGLQPTCTKALAEAHAGIKTICTFPGMQHGWHCFDRDAPEYVNNVGEILPGAAYWVVCDQASQIQPPVPGETTVDYFHPDHIGSTALVTDGAGEATYEAAYYPFGTLRYEQHGDQSPLGPHYGFADKELDTESGLHYFEERYLAADLGRFTRPDPLSATPPQGWLAAPQTFNSYSYALNNPLAVIDPDGRQPEPLASYPPAPSTPPPPGPMCDVGWFQKEQKREAMERMFPQPLKEAATLSQDRPMTAEQAELTKLFYDQNGGLSMDYLKGELIKSQDPREHPINKNLDMIVEAGPLSLPAVLTADPNTPGALEWRLQIAVGYWGFLGGVAGTYGAANQEAMKGFSNTERGGVLIGDAGTVRGIEGNPTGPIIPEGAPIGNTVEYQQLQMTPRSSYSPAKQ